VRPDLAQSLSLLPIVAGNEITSALDAILTTDKFLASPQMSAFLRYVVEQTLIGNTRRIKAFTVGIEALGKPASFDPQTDPSVRVLAKRLRSSLDTYYLQNPETKLFIEMKPGSYVPKFLLRSEMSANTQPTAQMNPQATNGHEAQNGTQSVANADTTNTFQADNIQNPAQEHSNAAHVSINQKPTSQTGNTHTDAANTETCEDQEDRNTSLNQLWQAYKTSSKVA